MRRRQRGFTFVELLIVIAVIIILLAILLPSMSRARARMTAAKCINNLRQCAIATASYSIDNGDSLPYPVGTRTIAKKTVPYESELWYNALDRYLSKTRYGDLTRTNAAGVRSYMKWKECPLWDSISTESTMPAVNTNLTIREYSRTIKMNSHLRRIGGDFARSTDIDRPSMHVLYGDGTASDQIDWAASTYETKEFSMDVNVGGVGGIAIRHLGSANIVYLDGHATTETLPTYQRTVGSSGMKIESWQSEFVNGSGTPVNSGIDGTKSMEAQGLRRNSAMPLIWSIPGRLYRP